MWWRERQRLKAVHMRLLLGSVKWSSKDGSETPIVEMSDGHLVNSIAMIKRSLEADTGRAWRAELLPFLEDEQSYRKMMSVKVERNRERGI